MPKPPKAQVANQMPRPQTGAELVDYFRSPLGQLAMNMEPSEAMNSLTPTARSFVLALIEQGGKNLARAARMAGYNGNDNSLNAIGSRLCADPRVQRALADVAMGIASASSITAVNALVKMVEDESGKTSDKTKLTAVAKIISIIGLEPDKSVNMKHTIAVEPSSKDQIAEIIRMSREIGVDPRRLLGRAGVTIDAEFEQVGTSAGLEDLLGDDE